MLARPGGDVAGQSIWVGPDDVRPRGRHRRRLRLRPDGADGRRLVRAPPDDGARCGGGRHRCRHARAGAAVGALIDAYGWRTRTSCWASVAPRCWCWPASAPIARRSRLQQAPAPLRQIVASGVRHPLRGDRCVLSMSLFVPFVLHQVYATDEGIDAGAAATLVGIIGASSVVGGLGFGGARRRLGATRPHADSASPSSPPAS